MEKIMKKLKLMFFTAILFLAQISHAAEELTVAVAANVKYAFDDLAIAFTQESGIVLKPIFGSSGKIASQVKEGAPYDVFLSADMAYPQKLFQDGHALAAPKVYAFGKLVIWTTQNKLDLKNGLPVLASSAVTKVAIANPKVAPYGAQALVAIEKLGLRSSIEPKLVFAENIAQVMQYVESANVDVGITAKSLVTAELAGKGHWVDIPTEIYSPIAQGAVILRYGQKNHGEAALKFYDFLYAPKAREILKKFDYILP
jgi:molybdate transport system substrate-binding protein